MIISIVSPDYGFGQITRRLVIIQAQGKPMPDCSTWLPLVTTVMPHARLLIVARIIVVVFQGKVDRAEFEVSMYWKDPPRANRDTKTRGGEVKRFVRVGLSSI